MKNLFTLLIGMILFVTANAQTPQLNWVKNYDGPVNAADRITDADFDPATGYTYVTGVSDSTVGYNYVTIKYSSAGQIVWRKRYSGPQYQDSPNAIKYDPVNNAVYVTGKSKGKTSNFDWLTIRYNAATGDTVWTKRYNGTRNGDDEAIDLDIDASGNVYVVGSVLETYNNRLDVKTIKYNATNGNVSWTKSISSRSYDDNTYLAHKIAVNANKVVIIYSYTDINAYDPTYYGEAEGYLISDGSITRKSYDSPASIGEFTTLPFPITFGIAFDGLGNVYVCGGNQPSGYYSQIQVTKLSTDINTVIWMQRTIGHEGNDWANDIIVDANYNAYITGYSDTLAGSLVNNNIITSKYNSTGNLVWAKTYDGIGDGDDKGFILARNNLSNPDIWVTGYTSQTNNKKSITTIKYDNNGNLLWSKDYNCGGNGDNYPTAMYRDPNDNIIIAGYSSCNGTDEDYLTLKYCASAPAQPDIITGNTTVCSGTSQTYSISPVTGAISYTWSLPAGWSGTSTTTSITTVAGTNSGNVSVVANGSICSSPAQILALTALNTVSTAGTITGSTTACSGTSQTYSISPVTGAISYIWTLPVGATGTSTTNSIVVNYGVSAASGNITVKGHNDCNDGASSTLPIVVNAKPNTPIVTSNNNILQSSASTGYQWYNQSGAIAGAITQNYTPSSSGDYYVIVSSNGCTSSPSNTMHFIPTGINPIEFAKSMKAYPNPVTNELTIELEGNTTKTNFEILNSLGQVVYNGNIVEKTVIQTTGFASGVYMIKLKSGKSFEFKKIIKN